MFFLVASILCQLGANQKKNFKYKKKILVKFFGKFCLVGQLGLVIVDLWTTWCNCISHNPFVTRVSNLQRKYQRKDSKNYKCKTGKV